MPDAQGDTGDFTAARMLVEPLEEGIESRKQKEAAFFDLGDIATECRVRRPGLGPGYNLALGEVIDVLH